MGFQRVFNPLAKSRGRAFGGVWGKAPHKAFKRSAKGELKAVRIDLLLRGNALQERAFPYFIQSNTAQALCGVALII